MVCYISSNENRFYAALEPDYGVVPAITARARFPGRKLDARQWVETPARPDKTGSRTFLGAPAALRKRTTFQLTSYMTAWNYQAQDPGYGPLFQAALGGEPIHFAGGTVAAVPSADTLRLTSAHGLSAGQAITVGGEIRFVSTIVDLQTVQLNVPLTDPPPAGAALGATVTYPPGSAVPSVSVFDYWSPSSAVHRILGGAAVDVFRLSVNGDFHEFEFGGFARELIDSTSFSQGEGGLLTFPPEPMIDELNFSLIPGHLGQAWLGMPASQFLTVTSAELTLDNDLDARAREFGSPTPTCIVPGMRSVTVDFSLYSRDDSATHGLYQAARQRSPISVMLQLGEQPGQLFGIYLKSVVPEIPTFDDRDNRLQWRFASSRAQGTFNDEIFVAFG